MNTDKNMLKDYLDKRDIDEKMLAFIANLNLVYNDYPEVAQAICIKKIEHIIKK